jgi:PAS domain-containing protein
MNDHTVRLAALSGSFRERYSGPRWRSAHFLAHVGAERMLGDVAFGSRFRAIVSVTALRDAGEGIIGYLLIGTDNTARKQDEAAQALLDQQLRNQQFYTRSLIESNIDALMMTDPHGIISDVNQQMIALETVVSYNAATFHDRAAGSRAFLLPPAT